MNTVYYYTTVVVVVAAAAAAIASTAVTNRRHSSVRPSSCSLSMSPSCHNRWSLRCPLSHTRPGAARGCYLSSFATTTS